jgi:hypothetical protein
VDILAAHPFKPVFQVGCDKQAVAWLAQVLRQRPASAVVFFNNKDGMAWVDISCIGLLGFGRRMGTQTAQGEVLKFFPMTKVGF